MDHKKIKMLCEAAMMLAFAQILGYIRLYEFPNGGSIDAAMLPVILFSVRYGIGWGTLVGFAHGCLQYFLGKRGSCYLPEHLIHLCYFICRCVTGILLPAV